MINTFLGYAYSLCYFSQFDSTMIKYHLTDFFNVIGSPVPALISFEIKQGALEQATRLVLKLRIEGPFTEGTGDYGYKTK